MIKGCIIHGYDHTISKDLIKEQEKPDQHFFIHPLGIGTRENGSLTTLEKQLQIQGHLDKTISYLKVKTRTSIKK